LKEQIISQNLQPEHLSASTRILFKRDHFSFHSPLQDLPALLGTIPAQNTLRHAQGQGYLNLINSGPAGVRSVPGAGIGFEILGFVSARNILVVRTPFTVSGYCKDRMIS
jgi:hypothetical protein